MLSFSSFFACMLCLLRCKFSIFAIIYKKFKHNVSYTISQLFNSLSYTKESANVFVSLTQFIKTMHNICKIPNSNPNIIKKKKKKSANLYFLTYFSLLTISLLYMKHGINNSHGVNKRMLVNIY